MAEITNFRQVGKEAGGRVFKGSITDAYHRTTSTSIPSKFELVLAQSNTKEAFGSAAQRFGLSREVAPGPGDYNCSEGRTSPSESKQGYGGLISKSTRFKRFQYISEVPGPGAYVQLTFSQKSKPSHMFVTNQRSSPTRNDKVPGVGHYKPKLPANSKAVTSAFISSSKRFDSGKAGPSPSTYSPNLGLTRANSTVLKSVFMPPTNSKRHQVNLYDPHRPVNESPIPGPGEYELASVFKSFDGQSSSIKLNESSRFGESLRSKNSSFEVPGPGTYQLLKSQVKVPVSGASFMSESDRIVFCTAKKPPGPAYYKPVVVPKNKSFHLNITRNWM